MAICPSCKKKVVSPIVKSKPYLVIKDYLTNTELEQDFPFVLEGKNKYGKPEKTTSYYLQKELGMLGVNFQQLSFTALWSHQPPKAGRTKEGKERFQACLDFSIGEIVKVANDRKLILLLMGAELSNLFIGHSINDVSGLVAKSDLLPGVPVIIPSPDSNNLMKMPIGELRLALSTFAKQIKIYEEYSNVK